MTYDEHYDMLAIQTKCSEHDWNLSVEELYTLWKMFSDEMYCAEYVELTADTARTFMSWYFVRNLEDSIYVDGK